MMSKAMGHLYLSGISMSAGTPARRAVRRLSVWVRSRSSSPSGTWKSVGNSLLYDGGSLVSLRAVRRLGCTFAVCPRAAPDCRRRRRPGRDATAVAVSIAPPAACGVAGAAVAVGPAGAPAAARAGAPAGAPAAPFAAAPAPDADDDPAVDDAAVAAPAAATSVRESPPPAGAVMVAGAGTAVVGAAAAPAGAPSAAPGGSFPGGGAPEAGPAPGTGDGAPTPASRTSVRAR